MDDDLKFNAEIEKVINQTEIEKAAAEKKKNEFTCPFCQWFYKNENLPYSLACYAKAKTENKANADSKIKEYMTKDSWFFNHITHVTVNLFFL